MDGLLSRHGRSQQAHPDSAASSAHPISADIEALFNRFSSNGFMSVSNFCKFLKEVQREDNVSEAHASKLMRSFQDARPGPQFNVKHFQQYLFDAQMNYAIQDQIHQDMNLPLSYYYIFTGHNSYLTGNQLSSKSSEKAIIKALKKGIRVVELDLWPGDDGEIDVLHGWTLTSPVKFEACLSAIKDNAFIKSQYPLIITLEDHLSVDLQAKAAKVIKDMFGPLLYYPPFTQEFENFPSPEELKGMILISTKPPKEDSHDSVDTETKHTEEDSDSSDLLLDEEDNLDRESAGNNSSPHKQENCNPVSQEYMKIIAIPQGKKGKSVLDALRIEEHAKRISLSELRLSKIAASHPLSVVRFTQNNILRVYPRGRRFNSSNYDPMKAWLLGAQMVALNMQGYGKHLWVAEGFFRANGGCGYVKKPKFILSGESGSQFSLYYSKDTTLPIKQTLKVKVCMGHGWREQLGEHSFDKLSPPDFLTRVGIAGVKADKVMQVTAVKKDKWEPIWGEEFEFRLRVPELAVLRVEVLEDNISGKVFAGQVSLPVSELRSGYRIVTLCDKKGKEWELVKLLLHINISRSSSSGSSTSHR